MISDLKIGRWFSDQDIKIELSFLYIADRNQTSSSTKQNLKFSN